MNTTQEARFDPRVVSRLDDHFRNLIRNDRVQAASYLLAQDGRTFASNAFGRLTYRDGNESPMRTDTIRRIASVTKLFGAVAVFQLVEQGKLYLGQSVGDWIEEFKDPMFAKIQIRHLLTHTSGLWPDPSSSLEPYPFGHWDIRFAHEPDLEGPFAVTDEAEFIKQKKSAWIRALLSMPPACKPGEQWNYSSAGFAVIGEVVARATGVHFEEYVLRHITEPLGMTRTFFNVPGELRGEVCVTNEWDEGRLENRDRTYDPPRVGGGLHSTLDDLFRFGQMLLNKGTFEGKRILSRKSVERMTRDELAGKKVPSYCWGADIPAMKHGLGPWLAPMNDWFPEGTFGHEGAGRCRLLIDPSHNAVVAFFVPTNVDWAPESMVNTYSVIWSGWQ